MSVGGSPVPRVQTTAYLTFAALLLAPVPATAQSAAAFSPDVYAERRARLRQAVNGAPVIVPGAYLIRGGGRDKQDPNFWYLTGVESSYAVLVLGINGREALFLPDSFQFAGGQYPTDDPRFRRSAWNLPTHRLAPGPHAARVTGIAETYSVDSLVAPLGALVGEAPVIFFARDGARRYAPPGLGDPRSYLQQLETAIGARLPGRRMVDVTPHIERMRLIKDRHEIAALRRAAEISVAGLLDAMRAIRPGATDLEIAGVMEATWKREGSPRASFGPIVASGESAVSLYTLRSEQYDALNRRMLDGELVFIDYGAAEYRMYASDLCRTFPVSGRFTPEQRRYYEMVVEAGDSAYAQIRPGVMMRDVIRAAARVFRRHGLEHYEDIDRMGVERVWGVMPSPTYWLARDGQLTDYSGARGTGVRDLGHHVGLEASDSREYSMPLEPGMVFTVEPKLYIPELGIAIMIEDMILVTETGYENLSAGAPRTVAEIEAVMTRRPSPNR